MSDNSLLMSLITRAFVIICLIEEFIIWNPHLIAVIWLLSRCVRALDMDWQSERHDITDITDSTDTTDSNECPLPVSLLGSD